MSLRYKGGVISATPPTTTGGTSGTAKGVWTLEQQMQAQAAGNWPLSPPQAVQISRSLRFNSADSAYLNRTPASSGNLKTWTISLWVKRSALGTTFEPLISNLDSSALNGLYFFFGSADKLKIGDYGASSYTWEIETTQVFRDPSAWYHIVIALDTTQATASNRFKLYVNGSQVTAFGTATYPTQNSNGLFNNTSPVAIGRFGQYTGAYASYYLTNIDFVDGQALTPSSFGQTNSTTGVWEPIQTVGYLTYGTNGFHVDFADNSGTTSTTLGKDTSGNSNNWTPNNFSVTAGTGNDSLVDTPTPYGTDTGAGGEVRGNYCTMNPLSNSAGSIVNGNLQLNGTSSVDVRCNATMAVSSGKWYFETTLTTAGTFTSIGIGQGFITTQYPGKDALSYVFTLEGAYIKNNDADTSYGSALTSGDVFMCAFDLDSNKVFFGKNGTWFGSSNPATGANPAYSITAGTYTVIARPYSSSVVTNFNFGQRPFAYTAPSGFKALVTQNLPTPTIVQPDDYFNTVLYTGNDTARSITGVGFQPDFTWIKVRSTTFSHRLFDAVRGATKALFSNLTTAETTETTALTSFDSDGFSLGGAGAVNNAGSDFVAWNWKANGAGSSNTAGTISSTVSANTTAGFSIVRYTGNGTAGATVGHGLGAVPQMIIFKLNQSGISWNIYHVSLGNQRVLYFATDGQSGTSALYFNNTTPSSTVFTLGSGYDVNNSGSSIIAYCFAPVAGFSAFGSYTGNGSADGPFIYTGFRPAMIWTKPSSTTGPWNVLDNKRGPYNVNQPYLQQNSSNAEATVDYVDFLSNGFKIRYNAASPNANGVTVIWCALAENPFKYALAR